MTATPDELKAAYFGELTPEQARAVCRVSRRTWRRWHDPAGHPPSVYVHYLRIVAQGEVTAGPEWEGWVFHRGKLCSPERVEVTPGEIRALPFMRALLAELQRENKKLSVNIHAKRVSSFRSA